MNIWGAKHSSDLDAQHSTRHAMAAICGDCEKQVEASMSWCGGNQAAALISLLCLPHTEAGAIGMMKHLLTATRRVAPLPCQPATIRANLRHFPVDLFVDLTGKPLEFLNEIAKRVSFEPRHSRQFPHSESVVQPRPKDREIAWSGLLACSLRVAALRVLP
jgi:hypothetical protein